MGQIHYWTAEAPGRPWLVFLPGLTADRRLFDKQTQALSPRFNCLVWDAPAHGASRPFTLAFPWRISPAGFMPSWSGRV